MGIKQQIQKIALINEPYTRWKWRERRVSYGPENPDKTFFVIRRANCKVGLFSYIMINVGWIDYAIEKGYIPVVDMQSNANNCLDDDKVGKENAWEYFFEQPCGYTLADIAFSSGVILSSGLVTPNLKYPDFRIVENQKPLDYWHSVFQKYLRPSERIRKEFQQMRDRLFKDEKVLGILARGTDYVSSRPKGHPVQPSAEQIIEKAREVTEQYSCSRIYLATEDAVIYEKLKEAFGDTLIAPDTERYTTTEKQNINDLIGENEKSKAAKSEEYLLSIMLLAECACLVAGNAGGTHGALLMSKGYEYRYIFQLGNY